MSGSSVVVAAKLNDPASVRLLQYVLRSLADRDDTIHLVVVVFQKSNRSSEQRREAQDLVRRQFGSLLPKSRPHRLHIVRLLTGGQEADVDKSSFIGRAICSKAAALESDVIVVGGRARSSASGTLRSSAVAEAVRRHSRRSVLLISDEHPLLCTTLPAIAEELGGFDTESLSDEEELLGSSLLDSPRQQCTLSRHPSVVAQLQATMCAVDPAHLAAARPAANPPKAAAGAAAAAAAAASSLSIFAC